MHNGRQIDLCLKIFRNITCLRGNTDDTTSKIAMATSNSGTLDGHVFQKKKTRRPKSTTDLTIGDRKKLIAARQAGASVAILIEQFDVSRSTVTRVWKKRKAILNSACDARRRVGNTVFRPVLEARLLAWLELVRGKNIRLQVSASALCVAAAKISKSLLRSPPTELTDKEKTRLKGWTPGDSWVQRFVKRNGLVSVALHGTAGDVRVSEITDEIDLNDEPEEILEVTDDGNKEEVVPVEQPGTSKSEVMDAAMQALQFFAAAEMESVPWATARSLLAAVHASLQMAVRTSSKAPPGLLGEYRKIDKSLLNSRVPKCKQAKITSLFTKKSRREIAMATNGSEDQEFESV